MRGTFPGPWPPPEHTTLTGQFVTLRPTEVARDTAPLFAAGHATDDARALWRFMASPGPFASEADFGVYLASLLGRDDWQPFTVFRDGAAIGMISLLRIEPTHGVAELGSIWYTPSAQRTEANTEATYLLLRHLFETHGYRRAEWKCDSRNEPSRRAALRLGFQFEGIFRKHLVVKNQSRDTCWYAITDDDWPRVQANLERWLYSDRSVSLTALSSAV